MTRKWTNEECGDFVANLTLVTTLDKGAAKFEAKGADLPLNALERFIAKGFQRYFNDQNNFETVQEKIDSISLELGEMLAGTWVNERKNRAPAVPIELACQRKAVLQVLDKKQKLDAFGKDATADHIAQQCDAIWIANEDALRPIYDKLYAAATATKEAPVKIKLPGAFAKAA